MDSFNRLVQNMMDRFGGPLVVVVVGDATYNPATSENVATETTYEVQGAVLDYTLKHNGEQSEGGNQIQMGDKQVFLQPFAELPPLRPERDFIEFSGQRWKIVTYKETNPSLTSNVLIELMVRR